MNYFIRFYRYPSYTIGKFYLSKGVVYLCNTESSVNGCPVIIKISAPLLLKILQQKVLGKKSTES